jgi:hypothetical protein
MRVLLAAALTLSLAAASAAEEPYEPQRGFDPALALGIGHLRPVLEEDRDDWLPRLEIPIFDAPGGRRVPLPERRMPHAIETGYETVSILVLEARGDGWLRLPFGWVHRKALQTSRPALEFETWEHLFKSDSVSPLYFRLPPARHALHSAPAAGAPLVAWIPADPKLHAIEPISFTGDWARVRVSLPSDYCAEPGAPKPDVRVGWIRWRDAARGPWLWYYTRGC